MSVKVSVVIPVYNPGKYIDPCIDSLLRQTLPADEFEVLFVNDGSTDDTRERLEELATRHPHFRVITIPNSGWPGKPRNIGVAEAAGEYVQFVDQDDYLASEALQRLYAMGHRNGSDIVIGKVASNFRGVPHGVFKVSREKCTLRDAPLYDSLTPHKMFRTEFLRENGIAYPEGKRRLEDQLYMMQAYFPAKVVSILGNYTCYFYSKRDDGKNAGSAKIVPSGYYGNLREVLDVVVENTEPGEFRDLLLRRFYRVEMLSRLSEPAVLKYTPEFLDEMCDAVEDVAKDFMDDGVHDGLGPVQRLRSTLLRNDDRQGLLRIARFAASVKAGARLDEFAWQPNGEIAVTVSGRLVHGDDKEPLRLLEREGRYFLHPDFTGGLMPEGELLDVTDDLDDFSAEISLRNRETAVEWPCPSTFTTEIENLGDGVCEVVLHGSGTVSSERVKGRGRVSRGFWDVWVPLRGLGLVRKARLGADRAPQVDAACLPASLGSPARAVIPYFTEPHGNLTLDVARRGKKLAPYLADRPVLLVPGSRPELRLDLLTAPKTARSEVRLVLSSSGAAHTFPSTLVPTEGRAHLLLPALAGAPAGTWQLAAQLDGGNNAPLHLFEVSVDARGRIKLPVGLPLADRDLVNRVNSKHRKVTVRRALSAVGGPLARRLPSRARAKARRLANRIIG
ncbi:MULTISPECIES: glycosyltransferase family A protein [Streptomyces]|uniref:Glycosyltransferase family A protein n=1 Tax=Streptomyces glycanivorans TaxID=3033808 RepID=A0ABY9JKC8_9ACTN|nr:MULTISPECIES: glycosyltransferase family A protein [unclassified Streptomyces]WLQ66496.1 glycosyltransferase family A protein [Streptomyces sp. Alt3]WSQ79945.1 glycosyltransferase family 2 protein [Streptomyces sp. NBC_01213]WSQ87326.1 glycosyltransferase family 2 protein [Streptomyces sp. NBC_01212]WSR06659.1 glycosyltransferase family 2 protein [Streptomyces sp. NBC_01208]